MARPTKYDDQRAAAILDNLRRGNTRRASTLAAGISEDSLARWLGRYADFADAVEKAENEAEIAHVNNIGRWAASGNWQASAWWLERRRHQDWRKPPDETTLKHTGPDGASAPSFTIRIDRAEERSPAGHA